MKNWCETPALLAVSELSSRGLTERTREFLTGDGGGQPKLVHSLRSAGRGFDVDRLMWKGHSVVAVEVSDSKWWLLEPCGTSVNVWSADPRTDVAYVADTCSYEWLLFSVTTPNLDGAMAYDPDDNRVIVGTNLYVDGETTGSGATYESLRVAMGDKAEDVETAVDDITEISVSDKDSAWTLRRAIRRTMRSEGVSGAERIPGGLELVLTMTADTSAGVSAPQFPTVTIPTNLVPYAQGTASVPIQARYLHAETYEDIPITGNLHDGELTFSPPANTTIKSVGQGETAVLYVHCVPVNL